MKTHPDERNAAQVIDGNNYDNDQTPCKGRAAQKKDNMNETQIKAVCSFTGGIQ